MTTYTQLDTYVRSLAVRIAQEIETLRDQLNASPALTPDWTNILNKPVSFAPAPHTSALITDFASAVAAVPGFGGSGTISAHLVATVDNTYDIGAAGTTRPRTLYLGTSLVTPDGSAAAPAVNVGGVNTGWYRDSGGGRLRLTIGGSYSGVNLGANVVSVSTDTAQLQFGSATDVILAREAAGVFGIRNGVNAQALRIYNTTDGGANYERAALRWDTNTFRIGTPATDAAGTGSHRTTTLEGNGLTFRPLTGSAANAWTMSGAGHLLAGADNTYDIGASGATRPRNLYVGGFGVFGTSITLGSTSPVVFGSRSQITSPADSQLQLINAAGTDFGRLQFGGTTSSFPAIKRNGTAINFRLADDSADAPITSGPITASGASDVKSIESLVIAASDESTALATGTGKVTFRMPYAFTVTDVRASLATAQTSGSIFTVDVNEAGTSILSTKLTIDNTEKTSTTAATPAVISDTSLADDAEITVDIDQIGDGTAKGLKVVLIGRRT